MLKTNAKALSVAALTTALIVSATPVFAQTQSNADVNTQNSAMDAGAQNSNTQNPSMGTDNAGQTSDTRTSVPADNTALNARDRSRTEETADQANNNRNDLDTMQQIRKAVVSDGSLSTYAHNIKIIARGGKVTLKGPVRSQKESDLIQAKAVQIAGEGNVINQLDVKSKSRNQ